MYHSNEEKQQVARDVEHFVATASEIGGVLQRRAEKESTETRTMSAKNPAFDICDPDVAEKELRQTSDRLAEAFAQQAKILVSDVRRSLEQEFASCGLETFADAATLQRFRELFPSRRQLESLGQLLRDAVTRTLQRRVTERIQEAEQAVGSLSRSLVGDPLEKATRDFCGKMLHYVSVTVGSRGDFLRKRFNLRTKALVHAAHTGALDQFTALSDEEDDEVTLYRRNPTRSASASNFASSSGSAFSSSAPGFSGGAAASAAAATGAARSRLPANVVPQRVTALEATSTAVLDELTALRERHERMSATRHDEITAIRAENQREMEQLRAAASEREHLLRTEAANLRVKGADAERVMRDSIGPLVRRLDLQSQRYKREISLLIELSRQGDAGKTVYAMMARRLTQLEREDGTLRDIDDSILQRLGTDGLALGAPCPSNAVLQKQHALLDATSQALHTHEAALAAHQEIDRLSQENSALRAQMIHVRNAARHHETQVRKESAAKELKNIDEIKRLKNLLSASAMKLNSADKFVIGTNDELTGDLVRKLEAAEHRIKMLEVEMNIQSALAQVVLREGAEDDNPASKQDSGVRKREMDSKSPSNDGGAIADHDEHNDDDDDDQLEAKFTGELSKNKTQDSSSRPQSAAATSSPVVVIPARYIEPDVRARLVARPPPSTKYGARPAIVLQSAVHAQMEYNEGKKHHVPLEAPPLTARAAGIYWTESAASVSEQRAAQRPASSTAPVRPSSAAYQSAGSSRETPLPPGASAAAASLLPAPTILSIEGGSKYKRDRERQLRAASTAMERRIEQQRSQTGLAASSNSRNWNTGTKLV